MDDHALRELIREVKAGRLEESDGIPPASTPRHHPRTHPPVPRSWPELYLLVDLRRNVAHHRPSARHAVSARLRIAPAIPREARWPEDEEVSLLCRDRHGRSPYLQALGSRHDL